MRNMENIHRTRDLRVGKSDTFEGKNYTLKGVFTAMARKIENNISRVQLWLQIAMTVFTIACVVFPWTYNQLVEKGREQERLERMKKTIEELIEKKNLVEVPAQAAPSEQETITPKPKPRKPSQAKSNRSRLNGRADELRASPPTPRGDMILITPASSRN
jgi:hypothetical protein